MTKLLTEISVPLQVPVPVVDAEGKKADRSKIILKRPKVRHAKRLAVLIGPQLLTDFLGSDDDKLDRVALAENIISALMTSDRLEELLAILADMMGEAPAFVEDIDIIDLPEIGKAMIGFFPALQSLTHTPSAPASPSSSAGSLRK